MMAKKMKKLFSLILALSMVMSTVSVMASAEGDSPDFPNQVGDYLEYDAAGTAGGYADSQDRTNHREENQ